MAKWEYQVFSGMGLGIDEAIEENIVSPKALKKLSRDKKAALFVYGKNDLAIEAADKLNKLGSQGWELVTVTEMSVLQTVDEDVAEIMARGFKFLCFFMKREVIE